MFGLVGRRLGKMIDRVFEYYVAQAAELIPGLDPAHPNTAKWVEVMILMETNLKNRRKWSRLGEEMKSELLAHFSERANPIPAGFLFRKSSPMARLAEQTA